MDTNIITFRHLPLSYLVGRVVDNKNGLDKVQLLGVTYPTFTELAIPNTFVYR